MQRALLIILLAVTLCGISAQAQSYRLIDLADRLSTQSESLAERVYNDYRARPNNNRSELESMMLAHQVSASANAFRRMVQDKRRESELRDAAVILSEAARRFPAHNESNVYWRDAQRIINEILRELQISGGGGGNSVNQSENDDIETSSNR